MLQNPASLTHGRASLDWAGAVERPCETTSINMERDTDGWTERGAAQDCAGGRSFGSCGIRGGRRPCANERQEAGIERQGRTRNRLFEGIGAATARRLARDGYAVTVNCVVNRDLAAGVAREIEAAGGRAIWVQADVSDPAAFRSVPGTARDTSSWSATRRTWSTAFGRGALTWPPPAELIRSSMSTTQPCRTRSPRPSRASRPW